MINIKSYTFCQKDYSEYFKISDSFHNDSCFNSDIEADFNLGNFPYERKYNNNYSSFYSEYERNEPKDPNRFLGVSELDIRSKNNFLDEIVEN